MTTLFFSPDRIKVKFIIKSCRKIHQHTHVRVYLARESLFRLAGKAQNDRKSRHELLSVPCIAYWELSKVSRL